MNENIQTIAAVQFDEGDCIDELLEAVVHVLEESGHSVAGCLQRETPGEAGCCSVTFLEEITDGSRTRISQALGSGSRGCRLDPQALADLSGRMLDALRVDTGFVVLNRFGKGEADGHGLRSVIETAFELGIPVLTAVRKAYAPVWADFTGETGTILPANTDTVIGWALDAARRRGPVPDAA